MSRRRIRRKPRPGFTVRHASDLLAVIPYLVGFHPTESIVAVLMRSDTVALTMRVDLHPTAPVADVGAALARQLSAVARAQDAARIALVGYSADAAAGQPGAHGDDGRAAPRRPASNWPTSTTSTASAGGR